MSEIWPAAGPHMTRQGVLRALFAGAGALGLAGTLGVTAAQAQAKCAGSGEISEPGTRLILLGTAGGPIIRKFRSQPSNLLIVDGRPYLVDCGAGCVRQLAWAGYQTNDVAAVFLTHLHLDHDADLFDIIAFDWVQGRKAKLPIWGPYGVTQMTQGALAYFAVPERIFSKEAKFDVPASQFVDPHEIAGPGVFYTDDKIKVTAAENTHYHTFDAGPDKSYAYRFDTPTRSIVFTGDTGPSEAVTELARNADVLVSEVIDAELTLSQSPGASRFSAADAARLAAHMRTEHLSPEEVGKMAAKAGVKMVVLTHIAPSDGSAPDAAHYTAGVKRFYNGPVIAGRDLLEI